MAQEAMSRAYYAARTATRLADANAALSEYMRLYGEHMASKTVRLASFSGASTTMQQRAPTIATAAATTISRSALGTGNEFFSVLFHPIHLSLLAFTLFITMTYVMLSFRRRNGHWPRPNWGIIARDLADMSAYAVYSTVVWTLGMLVLLVLLVFSPIRFAFRALWPSRAIAACRQHMTVAHERLDDIFELWTDRATSFLQRQHTLMMYWLDDHKIHIGIGVFLAWFVVSTYVGRLAHKSEFDFGWQTWYHDSAVQVPEMRTGRQPELIPLSEQVVEVALGADVVVASSSVCSRCQQSSDSNTESETALDADFESKSIAELARETFETAPNPTALVENVRTAVEGSVYCMTCKQWHCCELPY